MKVLFTFEVVGVGVLFVFSVVYSFNKVITMHLFTQLDLHSNLTKFYTNIRVV